MKIMNSDGKWVDGSPKEVGQKYQVTCAAGETLILTFSKETLGHAKERCIKKIKEDAYTRISSLDWMLDRVTRHESLGIPVKTTRLEVLQMQQDVESASDIAELAVSKLTTIEEVNIFSW